MNTWNILLFNCSISFNIREWMSLSWLAVNPWTKTKHLNMSENKSFKLNLSDCWFTFPAKLTKSSFSCFLKFKHLYLVWNKLFLLPKILDKNFIVCSNEISSDFWVKSNLYTSYSRQCQVFEATNLLPVHPTKKHIVLKKWSWIFYKMLETLFLLLGYTWTQKVNLQFLLP